MNRKQAVLTVLASAVCMSFAGLFVRLVDNADGFQILAFRGIAQGAVVWAVATVTLKTPAIQFIKKIERIDLLIGTLMACATCCYVFSLLNTSVASTLFILSIAPVFAALLGWMFINEKPTRINSIAIVTAIVGVLVMVGAGIDLDRTSGNLLALAAALAFACMLVTARKSGKQDVLAGNFLAAVFSSIAMAAVALTAGQGLQVSVYDLIIILAMGALTVGLGIALLSRAAPLLPAAEVSLLILLESVLAPIWVWLLLDEAMSATEIIGGIIILLSVAMMSLTRLVSP